jgi:hypothetical protein
VDFAPLRSKLHLVFEIEIAVAHTLAQVMNLFVLKIDTYFVLYGVLVYGDLDTVAGVLQQHFHCKRRTQIPCLRILLRKVPALFQMLR